MRIAAAHKLCVANLYAPPNMHPEVVRLVSLEAAKANLKVDYSFFNRADSYMESLFSNKTEREKLIIESYLAQAAVRIARSERRGQLEGEDFKAAVWLFHQPTHPDDPCAVAGETALRAEQARVKSTRGILNEAFARRLDSEK